MLRFVSSINMKKSIILLFCFFIFSCTKNEKTKVKYVKHKIEFLNWNLNIPENYILLSFDEYKNIIEDNSSDSITKSNKISRIEVLFDKINGEYAFFCDRNNTDNTFIIMQMLNQIPNEYLKNEIAIELHSEFRKKSKSQGYIYKPIENRLRNDFLIKIKGEKEYIKTGKSIFNTIYYSTNFGAVVTSENKELDFEKEMTE